MLKMTDALNKTLKECPKGKWFTKRDTVYIRRADYMLNRLVEAEKLESRVIGKIPDVYKEYRVL